MGCVVAPANATPAWVPNSRAGAVLSTWTVHRGAPVRRRQAAALCLQEQWLWPASTRLVPRACMTPVWCGVLPQG